jgi:hypothetical protein
MAGTAESRLTQRQDALTIANGVRLRRSRLRREVHALDRVPGMVRVAALLADREPSIATLFPIELLCWPRTMHQPVAVRFLMAAGVRDWRSVGELTDRQVALLAGMLRGERS